MQRTQSEGQIIILIIIDHLVLPGSNPNLVGAPVVPDTGWFNQKKKHIIVDHEIKEGTYYIWCRRLKLKTVFVVLASLTHLNTKLKGQL